VRGWLATDLDSSAGGLCAVAANFLTLNGLEAPGPLRLTAFFRADE
jgi:hypothetical protein